MNRIAAELTEDSRSEFTTETFRAQYSWREYSLGFGIAGRPLPEREIVQTYTDVEPEDL